MMPGQTRAGVARAVTGFVAAAFLVVGGSPATAAKPKTGTLKLTCSPEGAQVEIDGEELTWFRRDSVTIDVELDRLYDEGETFSIDVHYSGSPVPSWFFSRQAGSPVVSTLSQPWYASDWFAVKEHEPEGPWRQNHHHLQQQHPGLT